MKRSTLVVLALVPFLLGAGTAIKFPYVSAPLNATRTITEFEYRLLTKMNFDAKPLPVGRTGGQPFSLVRLDAKPFPAYCLVEAEVVGAPNRVPATDAALRSFQSLSSLGIAITEIIQGRIGDRRTFGNGHGLLLIVKMGNRPLVIGANNTLKPFPEPPTPADFQNTLAALVKQMGAEPPVEMPEAPTP